MNQNIIPMMLMPSYYFYSYKFFGTFYNPRFSSYEYAVSEKYHLL
jgi:hypothetical protein